MERRRELGIGEEARDVAASAYPGSAFSTSPNRNPIPPDVSRDLELYGPQAQSTDAADRCAKAGGIAGGWRGGTTRISPSPVACSPAGCGSISTTFTPTAAGPTIWPTRAATRGGAWRCWIGGNSSCTPVTAARRIHPVFIALAATIRKFDDPRRPVRRSAGRLSPGPAGAALRGLRQTVGLLPLLGQSGRPADPLFGQVLTRRSGCGWPTRSAPGCNWPTSARTWPRTGTEGGFTCRWPIAAASATTRGCSPSGECNDPFRRLMAAEVDQAEGCLRRGLPLVPLVPTELQLDVALFVHGGLAILEAIRRQNYDVWTARPTVSKWEKLRLLARCWWRLQRGTLEMESPTMTAFAGVQVDGQLRSYAAACCRRASRTSPPASSSCRPPSAAAMDALYAFMRHTDDLVDDRRRGDAPRRPGRVAQRPGSRPARRFRPARPSRSARQPRRPRVLPAMADAVAPLWDSAGASLRPCSTASRWTSPGRATRRSPSWSVYCERVASAVGLACIHVWGFRGPEALRPARAARHRHAIDQYPPRPEGRRPAGRIYLPADDLRALRLFGRRHCSARQPARLSPPDGTGDQPRRGVLAEAPAVGLAAAGRAAALRHDDGHLSRVVGKIARRPEDVFRRRIRLSRRGSCGLPPAGPCCRRERLHRPRLFPTREPFSAG